MSPLARIVCSCAVAFAPACESATPCDEDIRAQQIDETVTLQLPDGALEAELADETTERERGWRHRVCQRQGLLLVPDVPEPLPVWGCELAEPVDVAFILGGVVVQVQPQLAPCSAPCNGCPTVGDGLTVDAVLETPVGDTALAAGDEVAGIPIP